MVLHYTTPYDSIVILSQIVAPV